MLPFCDPNVEEFCTKYHILRYIRDGGNNLSSKATYISAFKTNLIATKRIEFKDKLNSSEKVAEAAAIAAVEELLAEPVDLNDFSLLENLDQKRQLFIIKLLEDGAPTRSRTTSEDAVRGVKSRNITPEAQRESNNKRMSTDWKKNSKYKTDEQLADMLKRLGFKDMVAYKESPTYQAERLKAFEEAAKG
jgi:hypothetical protein